MAFWAFSKKERVICLILLIILLVSTLILLEKINKSFMVEVPVAGGTISEGMLGSPRFINPVLAYSSTDNDLISLIYSGLMRENQVGDLIPDLAEKYEVSKDNLSYTFTLKDNIFFQDGEPVTADDIVFTINKVKDPIIKSPRKANCEGISVLKIDKKNVQFILKQPYASFLENTTLGILPERLWADSPIEINDYNINPIGSGPYQVAKVNKQSDGIIASLKLKPFKKFVLGEPYLPELIFNFYASENDILNALLGGKIQQASSISPKNAEILKEKGYLIKFSVLPRVFGLFFNQNQNQIFTNKHIAEAINLAIDKNKIVREVLSGYGVVIDSPIPPNIIAPQELRVENDRSPEKNFQKAQTILAEDGWKMGKDGFLKKTSSVKKKKITTPLEFSIATGNAPELVQTADIIRQNLVALGIKVEVKTFEIGNLNQLVIRPRKYDVLLFGQIINHESDLFAFWHSSQRKDPGLNIAVYTNAKADKILEEALIATDETTRVKKYVQFEDLIKKDLPAVFLYSPNFIYVVSKNLKGISIDHLISSSDRFSNSYAWYIKTDSVWKVFAKNY